MMLPYLGTVFRVNRRVTATSQVEGRAVWLDGDVNDGIGGRLPQIPPPRRTLGTRRAHTDRSVPFIRAVVVRRGTHVVHAGSGG